MTDRTVVPPLVARHIDGFARHDLVVGHSERAESLDHHEARAVRVGFTVGGDLERGGSHTLDTSSGPREAYWWLDALRGAFRAAGVVVGAAAARPRATRAPSPPSPRASCYPPARSDGQVPPQFCS